MAQDFVGSNNLNLLEPGGQFGTRLAGGKDAASPRYIFTRLSPFSRILFPDVDDDLLHHLEDDGLLIEPKYYCPIIPLLLVNGSQGIGTGWSTYIPQHNVRDILEHVRAKIDDAKMLPEIKPWARGFTGEIEVKEDRSGYRTIGKVDVSISSQPYPYWHLILFILNPIYFYFY
jgi:DNA topoisomerase-2